MKAIVTGVSGQDGYYMVELLQRQGIDTLGLTTNIKAAAAQFDPAHFPNLELIPFDYSQPGAIAGVVVAYSPDLIFNFAAKATGKGMFDAPFEMNRLNGTFVLDILEAIRQSQRCSQIAFCQASSSEMFGHVQTTPQVETTAFHPKSPYGASKLYAHNILNIYRATYGIRCCSAILYNHESVRRSTDFVTKKIAHGAVCIKLGLSNELTLGTLSTARDWGYAPEYVEAMYLMATASSPSDYIVASGKLNTVGRLCEIAFEYLGLDYRKYVRVTVDAKRSIESFDLHGDPVRIDRELGWHATRTVEEIMVELVEYELTRLKQIAS
jgi:GDPmannose 4,6-dehydratase